MHACQANCCSKTSEPDKDLYCALRYSVHENFVHDLLVYTDSQYEKVGRCMTTREDAKAVPGYISN